MSATLDAERLSAYWGGAPHVAMPGRTHEVRGWGGAWGWGGRHVWGAGGVPIDMQLRTVVAPHTHEMQKSSSWMWFGPLHGSGTHGSPRVYGQHSTPLLRLQVQDWYLEDWLAQSRFQIHSGEQYHAG